MSQVHIAITRRVRPGQEEAFESALREFARESLRFPGTTGVHLVGPVTGVDREYGILRSFANTQACDEFYDSEMFADWQRRSASWVEEGWVRRDLSGLEAFFRRGGLPPPRWKMAIVTWLGVFPTVLLWSTLLKSPLGWAHPYLASAITIALVVATLTWGVMPVLTKSLSRWLHGH
ncbi:antibiotic biosynthesis monooxygenase [Aeoliella sp. ICT_H6.2]|uniref:Antibiotic biosynthesis monooxygenase n=1 Tax=Aeoliella straminimaris TaxID=2954799 RepID=A0A9X2JGH2_9BACT|nr:antibiotic biosynthesis monooxygenase [Aeoliella straminimaris]MCO6045040.1 antibiotic biosynthesis monooxygenase [Aeoliella straminimaris]